MSFRYFCSWRTTCCLSKGWFSQRKMKERENRVVTLKKHMLDRRWSNCICLLRFHPKYCKSVSVFRCKLQLSLNLQTLLQRRSLVFFSSIFLMKKCISWLITEHWCHPRVHYCNWTREKGQAVKKIESYSWCLSPSGFSILMIQVH